MDSKGDFEEDEDGRTLTISDDPVECKAGPSSPVLHMDLDLSFAARKNPGTESNYTGIQEESILVIFELPDGSQGESMVSSSVPNKNGAPAHPRPHPSRPLLLVQARTDCRVPQKFRRERVRNPHCPAKALPLERFAAADDESSFAA